MYFADVFVQICCFLKSLGFDDWTLSAEKHFLKDFLADLFVLRAL